MQQIFSYACLGKCVALRYENVSHHKKEIVSHGIICLYDCLSPLNGVKLCRTRHNFIECFRNLLRMGHVIGREITTQLHFWLRRNSRDTFALSHTLTEWWPRRKIFLILLAKWSPLSLEARDRGPLTQRWVFKDYFSWHSDLRRHENCPLGLRAGIWR